MLTLVRPYKQTDNNILMGYLENKEEREREKKEEKKDGTPFVDSHTTYRLVGQEAVG